MFIRFIPIILFAVLMLSPSLALSAVEYQITTPIPGMQNIDTQNIGTFVSGIFQFSFIIVGMVAFFVIVYAGFQYVLSASNQSLVSDARDRLLQAFIGVVLLFGSVIILNTINPCIIESVNFWGTGSQDSTCEIGNYFPSPPVSSDVKTHQEVLREFIEEYDEIGEEVNRIVIDNTSDPSFMIVYINNENKETYQIEVSKLDTELHPFGHFSIYQQEGNQKTKIDHLGDELGLFLDLFKFKPPESEDPEELEGSDLGISIITLTENEKNYLLGELLGTVRNFENIKGVEGGQYQYPQSYLQYTSCFNMNNHGEPMPCLFENINNTSFFEGNNFSLSLGRNHSNQNISATFSITCNEIFSIRNQIAYQCDDYEIKSTWGLSGLPGYKEEINSSPPSIYFSSGTNVQNGDLNTSGQQIVNYFLRISDDHFHSLSR